MIKHTRLFLLISLFLISAQQAIAQGTSAAETMRSLVPLPSFNEDLSATFFSENRERLRDTLPDSSIAVLFSAPLKTKSNDISFPYHQDPDFFYFTGIKKENAMLLVFKDPIQIEGKWYREILFIEENDRKKEMWTGTMLNESEASDISGVGAVMANTSFKNISIDWSNFQYVFTNRNLFIERDDVTHPGDLMSMVSHLYTKCERADRAVLVEEGEDIFAFLRQKKSKEELDMIQRAVDITSEAHNNVMRSIKPGMTEYQVQAIIEFTFRFNGADGPAFPSIVASGDNGSIMHYTENNSVLIPGDMVVIDIGAQYEQYAADITRTIPVSGRYTEEQKQVYQLVLDAQTVAIRYARPGYKFWTPHEEAFRTIGKGLIKLGIIREWAEIGDYFMHGTSHYLGLDVHDAGIYTALKPGDVLTVEPGIYIPPGSPCDEKWWGIYVRIEDDILITDNEAKILSEGSPRTINAIEAMMQKIASTEDL